MTITFQCPNCMALRNAPDAMAGRRVRCPECDALVDVVPRPEAEDPGKALDGSRVEDERGTAFLQPVESAVSGETVLLEAVNVVPPSRLAPSPQSGVPPRNPPTTPDQEEEPEGPVPIKRSQLVETEMDMTPMVDATFQLLIFFMITAAFALQKSKEIPKPKSDEASTNVQQEQDEATNVVVVQIDAFNSYLVINADGDEEEAPSVVDLHTKLRKAHDGDSEGRVPTVLRIEAHGEALHERVITAIDAGNDAGFAEVQLASIEEDA